MKLVKLTRILGNNRIDTWVNPGRVTIVMTLNNHTNVYIAGHDGAILVVETPEQVAAVLATA